MVLAERFIPSDDIHPIDIVETVATHHAWDFDRLADDQIAMTVEGLRAYAEGRPHRLLNPQAWPMRQRPGPVPVTG